MSHYNELIKRIRNFSKAMLSDEKCRMNHPEYMKDQMRKWEILRRDFLELRSQYDFNRIDEKDAEILGCIGLAIDD